jgi:hypothetical protein
MLDLEDKGCAFFLKPWEILAEQKRFTSQKRRSERIFLFLVLPS